MSFYAVAKGRTPGVFLNWNECNSSVKGYSNAVFKKFKTRQQAQDYIRLYANETESPTPPSEETKNTITRDEIPKFLNNSEVKEDFIPDYYVYTDGSCSNNGKKNAVAGIGVFFGIDDTRNISQKIKGKQTNNTAELSALIQTYSIIENDIINGKRVAIISDSIYAIRCVSTYGEKCERKNWKTEIPNKELVKKGYELYKNQSNIRFIYVKAHTNKTDVHSVGNDNADRLAKNSIGLEQF